jgi:formylmethanofuran dehydrogenase subunit E
MDAERTMETEEFKRCAAFHGHVCPGLSMGFRAAKAGMHYLEVERAEDEELVAVVETDACSADAVQVLTGCTFGKGNFIYKDYGKMVLTLLNRKSGRGVRVALRPGAFAPDEEHMALIQKVMQGKADEKEAQRFQEVHFKRSRDILEMPEEALFAVQEVRLELPARARIEPSQPCARCGEPTMPSKLQTATAGKICRDCFGKRLGSGEAL